MRNKLHRHHNHCHHCHKHDNDSSNHNNNDDDDDTLQNPPVVTITPSQPLMPRPPSEQQEFDQLNQVDSEDEAVPHATIVHPRPDQNRLSPLMRNETPATSSSSSSQESEGETSSSSSASSSTAQIDLLSQELKHHQQELQEEDKEEDLYVDKQLLKTTEGNRHISSPEPASNRRTTTTSSSSAQRFHRRLVFTEPIVNEQTDRVTVSQYYGQSTPEQKSHHKPRVYLVASDFSKESRSALEWTMGTMLRDHDEIHVVTVVSQEQDLAELDMTPAKVLQGVSKTLNAKSKVLLSHMLLFNVKLVTVAARGHVREVLQNLINEIPVTMVVCGCRGRSTMKGMLMGSVSTYLLHKAPVPVSVIRYHKKKKHKSKRKSAAHAAALSESMKTGHLVVDELGTAR